MLGSSALRHGLTMPIHSANPLNWLHLLLLLPAAIEAGVRVFDRLRRKGRPQKDLQTDHPEVGGLLTIEQPDLSSHPPKILSIVSLVCASTLLVFGTWIINMWRTGTVDMQVDFVTALFFVLFMGVPVYILVDHFLIQPKYYKLGRSLVAKEARAVVANDADTVFDASHRVLGSMQAAIRKMDKPRLLKARVGNSVMTIKIRGLKGSKARVYMLSDSKWLTVKWDAGANQRNVDRFLQELGKQ